MEETLGVWYSSKLEAVLSTRKEAAGEEADGSCTSGYDNDGSVGPDLFENGIDVGEAMEASKANAYKAEVDGVMYYVVAKTEDEAVAIAEAWDEDDEE